MKTNRINVLCGTITNWQGSAKMKPGDTNFSFDSLHGVGWGSAGEVIQDGFPVLY